MSAHIHSECHFCVRFQISEPSTAYKDNIVAVDIAGAAVHTFIRRPVSTDHGDRGKRKMIIASMVGNKTA